MERILLTGGAGYLGTALSTLLKNSYELRVLTRKLPSKTLPFVDYAIGDAQDPFTLQKACQDIDYVFHLVGHFSHPQASKEELQSIYEETTKKVCEAVSQSSIKKLVYFSTFHVYGNSKGMITEKTPCTPINEYGSCKLAGERIVSESDVPHLIIRLSNAYGLPSGAGWKLAINELCKQCLDTQQITLHDGGAKRDFVSIHDVACALQVLLQHSGEHNVFNIGSGTTYSMTQAATDVATAYNQATNKTIPISSKTNGSHDDFTYDISRLQKRRFTPKHTITQAALEVFS